jgi:hypothetical protein
MKYYIIIALSCACVPQKAYLSSGDIKPEGWFRPEQIKDLVSRRFMREATDEEIADYKAKNAVEMPVVEEPDTFVAPVIADTDSDEMKAAKTVVIECHNNLVAAKEKAASLAKNAGKVKKEEAANRVTTCEDELKAAIAALDAVR